MCWQASTISDCVGARSSCGSHAADGGISARIYGEEQARRPQLIIELLASDAGLDATVHVFSVHLLTGC